MNHYPEATRLFAAMLRGDFSVLDENSDVGSDDELRMAAAYHGVGPLVARALSEHSPTCAGAARLLDIFRSQVHAEAALELLRERELKRVLDAFAERNIDFLLIKGTPLGYVHYPSPALRPRGDTDLLIRENDRAPVRETLRDLGYGWDNAVSGDFISHQFTAEKRDDLGVEHLLDVHWKLSNQQLFADLFSFDELAGQSVTVSALGPDARTLDPVHALIFACTHRVGHFHAPYYVNDAPHYGGDRLVWLFDIHLLISTMSADEQNRFVALAAEKQVRSVCLDGLRRTRDYFDTQLSDSLLASLANMDGAEPTARYLARGGMRLMINEFRALPGWRARAALFREHAFPPADYVLRKYHVSNRAWLPVLYIHRGLRGAWRLVGRP